MAKTKKSASTERRHWKAYDLYRAYRLWPKYLPVEVRRANGETLTTITTSRVWYEFGGAYVCVEGIPGNTRLDRVTPLKGGA